SISTTSEPSFCHRFALCEFHSETWSKLLPLLTLSGTSASRRGSLISRKAEPSRTKTETELPRFHSSAVSANAFASDLHSTPSILKRALGPRSGSDSATLVRVFPDLLSIRSYVCFSASDSEFDFET